jgi:non-ribosomal peptide synthetase component F
MLGREDYRLLQRFSKGAARPDFLEEPLLHQVFETIVASSPGATCLIYGNHEISFLEVNHRANQLAHWLIQNGVKEETIVGVMVERSFDLIISILAILKAGGGYLPLDPSYPPERLAIYAEDAKAAIVLTQAHLLSSAAEIGSDCALIQAVDTIDLSSFHGNNPDVAIDSETTSLILFTSGSTGRPKGVQHAHRHLRDLLFSMRDYLKIGSDDVIMLTNTICFDVHALQIFAPLMFGAKLILIEPEGHVNGELVTSLWWRHRVTGMIFTVPFLAKEYLNNLHEPYPHMRMWGMGGDTVPLKIVRKMQEMFPNIEGPVNMYGPTEGNVVTQFRFSKDSTSPLIGRPDDNVHCYIVDATMGLVPVGVPGELLLSGPRLAKGKITLANT